ncbi:hypothetical protein [Scytonema sp. NUACC26]|uniref:hypothetical protein n=1 Tax=Scytonema sp. NUACC26 TaxID=3140176 RepID=UPI0038B3E755
MTKSSNERMDRLTAETAQDRQQAAIDRQEFRTEIRQIWEYLRDRSSAQAVHSAYRMTAQAERALIALGGSSPQD